LIGGAVFAICFGNRLIEEGWNDARASVFDDGAWSLFVGLIASVALALVMKSGHWLSREAGEVDED
jgi:hypothetical protein